MKATHFKEFVNGVYWRDVSLQEYRNLPSEALAEYRYIPGFDRPARSPIRNNKLEIMQPVGGPHG